MRLSDAWPMLYSCAYFAFRPGEGSYPLISRRKSQLAFRFMCFESGRVRVRVGDVDFECRSGDVLFLRPGDVYRFVTTDRPFSLYNVFFDFCEQNIPGREGAVGRCVIPEEVAAELCSPWLDGVDGAPFAECGLFREAYCLGDASALTLLSRDEKRSLYARRWLLNIICKLAGGADTPHGRAAAILDYLRAHPCDSNTAEELSARFGYHKNHVGRLIKAETGMTLPAYMRRLRIDRSKALIREGGMSPSRAARELGYYDYSHFYKAFVAQNGISPTAYFEGGDIDDEKIREV